MSELYREEPLKEEPALGWEVQSWGRICQIRTEGCWEYLEARSALIKYAPQSLVLGS